MKKLKQSFLFEKLKKERLSFAGYLVLYNIYNELPVNEKHLDKLSKDYYEVKENNIVITTKGLALLESIDNLFYAKKKPKLDDILGTDYKEKLKQYVELFPKGKLGSNAYARSNIKDLERNFIWFFQEYEDSYAWDVIIKATEFYIEEQRRANYKYTQTSMYFIRKADVNKIVKSNLANYCDKILDGDNVNKEHRFFKTNVI